MERQITVSVENKRFDWYTFCPWCGEEVSYSKDALCAGNRRPVAWKCPECTQVIRPLQRPVWKDCN